MPEAARLDMKNLRFCLPTVAVPLSILGCGLFLQAAAVPARVTEDFDADWRFSRGDFATAMMPAFDDARWQPVEVPHDWSSDGPFSPDWASGTGYAPGGVGWYRKHFSLPEDFSNRVVWVEFDGVYDFSEVWINGQFVGGRPYGYSSFACELTPFVRWGGDNVLAVRVDHSRFADSRYYTGSGIERNVRLVVADPLHFVRDGIFIFTPRVSENSAAVRVQMAVTNESPDSCEASLETTLLAPDGAVAARSARIQIPVRPGSALQRELRLTVRRPQLWSPDTPCLYRAVTRLMSGGRVLDEVTNVFGIREFHFDANTGFWLNGKNFKIKGVCLHDDAGAIGAAVPAGVWRRRLLALREIGANAIRTAHNPPDPVLLDLCDQLGFLVMDEAFDEFTPPKNKWVTGRNDGTPAHFGYGEIFSRWAVRDISDFVRRDRNHPSVILWSIGNEIDFANDPFSHPVLGEDYRPQNPPAQNLPKLARPLIAAVKSLDPTRPVTAALATVAMSDAVGLPELLDVVGYNYQETRYAADHRQFPKRIIYGSENNHSYGAWLAVKTNAFIAGQFLWTGADYLGEAGPWPNRASGAGLLDLCGFKKPLGWFRQSLWNDKPMVYLCAARGFGGRRGWGAVESWNWPAHSTVTVLCFANCPQVELSLNGKIIGTKTISEAVNGVLRWEIPFTPGILRAIGRDQTGRERCQYELRTAGAPARIELLPDTSRLRADGKDVCQVEFQIVDADGVRVPDADDEVTFTLAGPAKIPGIGNGDLNNVESGQTNSHRAFQGRGLVILQTTAVPGEITLRATAPGLESGSVILSSR